MSQPRLPDGFAVQVDRRVKVLGHGSALLGGSPTRLLKLAPAAREMLGDGRLKVRDDVSAQLARTLMDATVAHPRPAGGPSHNDVTVVIPVRDNPSGVRRLVTSLRGLRVIVVDDGSSLPISADDFAGARCDVGVLRHARSKGPGAARNTGFAACTTDFVAFLDSDVMPRRGWLEALLGHFCDPGVALVAPRIVGPPITDNLVARYEAVHSSLDRGEREAPVLPLSTVAYVPSAAIVCRCSSLRDIGGFDETMIVGEDVDLCWRLIEAGGRLRYEPIASAAHDHRTGVRDWLARKAFYGSSAAPLSVRHPDKTAPVVISGLALTAWILIMIGTRPSRIASLGVAVVAGGRVARAMRGAETSTADVLAISVRGLWSAALQLASALCRHYWPLSVLAALPSRRFRRVLFAAAITDGVVDWRRRRDAAEGSEPIGPLAYLALKRADDLAYGLGLWRGVVRERDARALKPQIRT
jgi:mycofactocin system glycosyltransferase